MTTRILLITFVLACGVAFGLFYREKPAAKQSIVSISRETTWLTEPLDEEGFVDYVAAVDQAAREGVTKENNYEVVVREVLGPIHAGEKQVEYYRKLGIKAPAFNRNFYVSYPAFAGIEELTDEHSRLMDRPWTAKEFPKAAQWVKLMDGHLDRLVEGSKRARHYTPYTILLESRTGEETSPMMSVSLEAAQNQREIARGLMIRVMQRLGSGDLDGAWSDLQAIRRMSRHVAKGWTAIEALVGCALDAIAFNGERHILQSSDLTADQARRFLADLLKIPSLPPLAEVWNQGERFVFLDALQYSARTTGEVERAAADWDQAFKTANRWYDRLTEASGEEIHAKRSKLFQKIHGEIRQLKVEYERGEWKDKIPKQKNPVEARGRAIGEIYIYLLFPDFLTAEQAKDRADARLALIRIGFALEIFQQQNGRYPKTLNELVPEYVKETRSDPFTGDALTYRPAPQGVLIYSVGFNNNDDQGQASWDDDSAPEEADDISVRVGQP